MFILSIFILQAISSSLSVSLRDGPDFNKNFQDLSNANAIQRSGLLQTIKSKENIAYNDRDKIFERILEFNKAQAGHSKKVQTVKLVPQGYIDHLKKKGSRNFSKIGKKIVKDMNVTTNITFEMDAHIKEYVNKLQSYYNEVVADKLLLADIDKEYLYYDIIEMANRLMQNEEQKLLRNIIMDYKYNVNLIIKDIEAINQKCYKARVKNKEQEFNYICYEYDVCRQFPTFSDHCADFISEVLKLYEDHFFQFIIIITDYAQYNQDLFAMLSEKEDRDLITSKFDTFTEDRFAFRQFLTVLRAVITNRFINAPTKMKVLKIRKKAVRILLDIIDKALGVEDEILNIDLRFRNMIIAFQKWASGKRNDIDRFFGKFVIYIANTLKKNLSYNATKEISVLIELIIRGTTTKVDIYERLFEKGSSYVKGDDFHINMDIF